VHNMIKEISKGGGAARFEKTKGLAMEGGKRGNYTITYRVWRDVASRDEQRERKERRGVLSPRRIGGIIIKSAQSRAIEHEG